MACLCLRALRIYRALMLANNFAVGCSQHFQRTCTFGSFSSTVNLVFVISVIPLRSF